MELRLHEAELPLRYPFTIARGTQARARSLVVELHRDGLSGYGEAPESSYYGYTVERSRRALQPLREALAAADELEPAALWQQLDPQLRTCRAAQSALDQAAWDLWGKQQGQPLHRLWGESIEHNPPTDYTIGIASLEDMVQKLQKREPWPVYKIKLGTSDDLARVEALRPHTAARLRVDANGGWRPDEARGLCRALAALGVELVEQPLAADAWESMRALYAESPLPLVADESCVTEDDVPRCLGFFHGINVKLCKCGGLTPARRMLREARRLGLRTMIGCMTETTIGISAAAQLLPLVDDADLDGPLLLARDLARGVTFERGAIRYATTPGTGVHNFTLHDSAT